MERVFITGGTGNVGSRSVNDLLLKEIPVTLYARNPEKAKSLFNHHPLVSTVKGDYDDFSNLKDQLKGHSRLLLVIVDLERYVALKREIATCAYEAGITQIVDISSLTASFPPRTTMGGDLHRLGEEAILNVTNRGYLVTLRPGRFMSNLLNYSKPLGDVVLDTVDEGELVGWISPDDIGAVAALVLSEDLEKHKDAVYELNGDAVSPVELAKIFSEACSRPFSCKKTKASELYNVMIQAGYSHLFAYGYSTRLASVSNWLPSVTDGIEILLGRNPETLKEFIFKHKDSF
ncbi:hypothetical protein G6F56_008287 [Rhizopus delemar]|nr:hypothetical protein G6F56_008287 [Rhizopus delemar]